MFSKFDSYLKCWQYCGDRLILKDFIFAFKHFESQEILESLYNQFFDC